MEYEIRIQGHLDPQSADWFGATHVTLADSGETWLTCRLADQAALYGLLRQLRDSGMTLIAVTQREPAHSDEADESFQVEINEEQALMKAIVSTGYGSPDVLQFSEVARPEPGANDVLIRIHASTVTRAHTMMRTGRPLVGRLFTGLRKPRTAIPGTELAGEVIAVGRNVTGFQPGDQVFGATDLAGGCNAEYACLPADGVLAHKPANASYAEAATLMDGALTAMHFLRDVGRIQSGQRVLVNGASGSVGTAAIQLAKYYGADVTGVCSSRNVELVTSLGADHIIDYTVQDFTQTGESYDIIFDTVGTRSFAECQAALAPQGVYLTTVAGLPAMLLTLWTRLRGGKQARFAAAGLRASSAKIADLALLKELVEAERIKPVIDRCYPLERVAEAHRYVDTGRKAGNIAITVA